MVAYRDIRARQIDRFGNVGIPWNQNRCFTNAIRLSPHNAFFNLRRLVYRPMASTADIAGVFAFASMSFGITFERSKPVVIQLNRRIDSGESRCVLTASLYIELVVEPFLGEIALFVGDPIVEPSMRLNNKFRHIAVSPPDYFDCNVRHHLASLQMPDSAAVGTNYWITKLYASIKRVTSPT